MNFLLQRWQLLLLILTDWVERQQQQVIEYLRVENQVLKEKLGKGRLLLNDDQGRRLAVKAKVLGRKQLSQVASLVTPDTLLRWHRQLVPQQGGRRSRRQRKPGRQPLAAEIRQFVVRMASENVGWGYDRIHGAMANLGYDVSASSIGNILRGHGIEPAPRRKRQTTWETFVKAHWEVLAPIDFTTITGWIGKWMLLWRLLFASRAGTRREDCLRCLIAPDPIKMRPVRRAPTAAPSPFPNSRPDVLRDRERESRDRGRSVSGESEVKPNWLPSRSLVLNVPWIRLPGRQQDGWQQRARLAA
jgi:putative transposase